MQQTDIFQTILRDTNYHLDLFNPSEIQDLRQKVEGNEKPFIFCPIRKKAIQLKPEELIRQLYTARLLNQYNYPNNRVKFEHPIHIARDRKRADIVILDRDRPDTSYMIVEVKKPYLQDGKEQLRSYCHATGAPIAVWTNGQQISHYHRKDPNHFEEIPNIPKADQTLADILNERFTLKQLFIKDKLSAERKSLKHIILELEDEVLANAGVDVFEEVFKLIFTKLYDEFKSQSNKDIIKHYLNHYLKRKNNNIIQESTEPYRAGGVDFETAKGVVADIPDDNFRIMEFRNTGQTDTELKTKIQRLFDEASDQWKGVFPDNSTFELTDSHLAICVSSLQDIKLFNSHLQIVDEAFEYLNQKTAKGEKGQYFTPRHVIDMCVKMLNPKRSEYMIDTASGGCGFPVHTIFHVIGSHITNAEMSPDDTQYVREKIFGIDFDEKAVRIARNLNLIAGDGESNVLHLNTLDYDRWRDKTENSRWVRTYGDGFNRLKKLRAKQGQNKLFKFDVLMANPPFAGDIKERRILNLYELGFKENRKAKSKVGRDILFIERNLDFLKPGGRMAIVLPQGRFNNTSDKYIRDFISEQARILAVIGLHTNTFKPHTGTKTSVLFLQKWNDDPDKGPLCPRVEDYPIFFAVSEKSGMDNSGENVYIKNNEGQNQLDKKGYQIVDHDLHDQFGELEPGIAEAFIDWAKSENLSFWS